MLAAHTKNTKPLRNARFTPNCLPKPPRNRKMYGQKYTKITLLCAWLCFAVLGFLEGDLGCIWGFLGGFQSGPAYPLGACISVLKKPILRPLLICFQSAFRTPDNLLFTYFWPTLIYSGFLGFYWGCRKKPININNNFAGLFRKWVGVKLLMCFPFCWGKNKIKFPGNLRKRPGQFRDNPGTIPCLCVFLFIVLFPALF